MKSLVLTSTTVTGIIGPSRAPVCALVVTSIQTVSKGIQTEQTDCEQTKVIQTVSKQRHTDSEQTKAYRQ